VGDRHRRPHVDLQQAFHVVPDFSLPRPRRRNIDTRIDDGEVRRRLVGQRVQPGPQRLAVAQVQRGGARARAARLAAGGQVAQHVQAPSLQHQRHAGRGIFLGQRLADGARGARDQHVQGSLRHIMSSSGERGRSIRSAAPRTASEMPGSL
jgi:hypothetical protein